MKSLPVSYLRFHCSHSLPWSDVNFFHKAAVTTKIHLSFMLLQSLIKCIKYFSSLHPNRHLLTPQCLFELSSVPPPTLTLIKIFNKVLINITLITIALQAIHYSSSHILLLNSTVVAQYCGFVLGCVHSILILNFEFTCSVHLFSPFQPFNLRSVSFCLFP